MRAALPVPIFDDLSSGGFTDAANYVVEFESNSLWYETSLTIAVQAVQRGLKTQYHTFMHIPGEVRRDFLKHGIDSKQLEAEDKFRLLDGYTRLTGLPYPARTGHNVLRPLIRAP
jgi:KaiC/GvpD/RAD55 family RecA-like ATPase